jgi:uncharacterized protein (DUF305 family)
MMKSLSMLSVALSSAVIGALLTAAVLVVVLPAASHETAHSAQHQHGHVGVMPGPMPACRASGGQQPSFQCEMAEVNARMHAAMDVAPSGDVNQDFIRMMIPHHQGAIDMARVLLKHDPDERLKRLAQSIIVEQNQEIIYMRTLEKPAAAEPPAAPTKKDQP